MARASERAEPAGYALDAGEPGVEQRQTTDATARDAQMADFRVDAIEGNRLQRRLDPDLPGLSHQPLGASVVDVRSGAMVALGIVRLDHIGKALLQRPIR